MLCPFARGDQLRLRRLRRLRRFDYCVALLRNTPIPRTMNEVLRCLPRRSAASNGNDACTAWRNCPVFLALGAVRKTRMSHRGVD